ncbi:MAG: hypothetical protein ACXAEJ_13955, partial [Candidatus Thorarchaeota archaeon]
MGETLLCSKQRVIILPHVSIRSNERRFFLDTLSAKTTPPIGRHLVSCCSVPRIVRVYARLKTGAINIQTLVEARTHLPR